jgi:hypothetical protein
MLLARLYGVRISVATTDISFLQNVQTGSGAHKWVTGFLPWNETVGGMKPSTQLHLVRRLRMSGATHLHSFMAWQRTF